MKENRVDRDYRDFVVVVVVVVESAIAVTSHNAGAQTVVPATASAHPETETGSYFAAKIILGEIVATATAGNERNRHRLADAKIATNQNLWTSCLPGNERKHKAVRNVFI